MQFILFKKEAVSKGLKFNFLAKTDYQLYYSLRLCEIFYFLRQTFLFS